VKREKKKEEKRETERGKKRFPLPGTKFASTKLPQKKKRGSQRKEEELRIPSHCPLNSSYYLRKSKEKKKKV